MKLNKNLLYTILGATAIMTVACSDDDNSTTTPTDSTYQATDEEVSAIAENYSNIVRANYAAALADAKDLELAIASFTTSPSEASFNAAKEAWITARESYGTTEAFRLSDGPIDRVDENGEEGPEGLLNSWPMDESVVDYVDGAADSGVINNTSIAIDIDTLAADNGGGDEETEVFVGFHGIEFLLWGQDNTDPSEELAGLRVYTDYTTADNAVRRADYLNAIASFVVENLEYLVDQWAEGTNYDVTFASLENDEVLFNLFSGLAKFSQGELAGERITPGLVLGSQEDEHSCFSDNTHRDIALNYEGIKNVYFGTYDDISGKSLDELVTSADAVLALEIIAAFETADIAIEAATTGNAVPFDKAILSEANGGNPAVLAQIAAAIDALNTIGKLMVTAASTVGVTTVVSPEV